MNGTRCLPKLVTPLRRLFFPHRFCFGTAITGSLARRANHLYRRITEAFHAGDTASIRGLIQEADVLPKRCFWHCETIAEFRDLLGELSASLSRDGKQACWDVVPLSNGMRLVLLWSE